MITFHTCDVCPSVQFPTYKAIDFVKNVSDVYKNMKQNNLYFCVFNFSSFSMDKRLARSSRRRASARYRQVWTFLGKTIQANSFDRMICHLNHKNNCDSA